MLKTDFSKILVLGMTQMAGGGGERGSSCNLVFVIMTHCVRIPICDSPLNQPSRSCFSQAKSF